MKKNNLPIEIDPIALAIKNVTLEGTYTLKNFTRLREIAKNEDLCAEFKLQFERNEEGFPLIFGTITVPVDLICERCNEIVRFNFEIHPRLTAIISENKAKSLPDDYEPVVTNGEPVNLSALIEDEILLEIPMIPKHQWGGCPST